MQNTYKHGIIYIWFRVHTNSWH